MSPVVSPHAPASSDSSRSRCIRLSSSGSAGRAAYPIADERSVLCPTNTAVLMAGLADSTAARYSAKDRQVSRSPRSDAQSEESLASP